MSLTTITLPTNKSVSIVDDDQRTLNQDEKGLIQRFILLDANGQAYNLNDKRVQFNEQKESGKVVIDDGNGPDCGHFTYIDRNAGVVDYTLQAQVYAASGDCWLSIITNDGTVVDTTKVFRYNVQKSATINLSNDNYISTLEAQLANLKSNVQRVEQLLDQENRKLIDQVNAATRDANAKVSDSLNKAQTALTNMTNQLNSYTDKYNNLQNQWNQQKQKIQSDADNQRNQIKAENDRARQDAINQINSARDNAIAQANRDFTDRINSLQNDYITWKNRTVADFNSTAKTIMDKINQQNANVDGVKKQMADIQNQISNVLNKFSSVDFTKFIKQEELARSGTNLLRNTENLSGFLEFGSAYNTANNYAIEYVTGHNGNQHSHEEGADLVQTAIFHAYGPTYHNVGLAFGQNVFLAKGTYTLSFVARCNGTPTGEHIEFFAINIDNNNQLNKLAVSDPITDKWKEYSLTFTIIEPGNYTNLRLHTDTNSPVPGGSMYYANLKLESGSIATGWTWNYDDILNAKDWPVSITDIHDIVMPGIYRFTNLSDQQWNALKNTPPGDKYTVIEVLSRESLFGGDKSIKAYPTTETGQIYYSSKNAGGWSAWNPLFIDTYNKGEIDDKIKNAGQVKKVNGISPDPGGNINIGSQIVRAYDAFAKGATQIAWENIGGSWLVDQVALGSIVDRINELGQRDLPANTDLNTFKVPGNWTIHNQAPYQNLPDDERWETLLVFAPLGDSNGMQVLLETNKERIIYRTWNSGAFKNWHLLIDDSLFNKYTLNDANTGIWNTTIDCNDYLGETRIWKLGNVTFRNGPIAGNHWGWLRTLRYDGNSIVQFYIDSGGQIWWRQTNDRGIRAAVWQRLLDTNDSTNLQNQINNLNNRMNSALTSYTTNNLQDGINHSNQNPNQIVFVTN